MHHAPHGYHLPGLLGLTVEVTAFLGWKGRRGCWLAGCTAHFLVVSFLSLLKGSRSQRETPAQEGLLMIYPWARGERERGVLMAILFMTRLFGT